MIVPTPVPTLPPVPAGECPFCRHPEDMHGGYYGCGIRFKSGLANEACACRWKPGEPGPQLHCHGCGHEQGQHDWGQGVCRDLPCGCQKFKPNGREVEHLPPGFRKEPPEGSWR